MLADPRQTNLSFGQPPTHPPHTLIHACISSYQTGTPAVFFKNNIKTLFNKIGLYE